MAFRPSLPPFILESAALRSQSAWTLMAQALLTGLVSGGVIGLFRWLYTIINGAVRAQRPSGGHGIAFCSPEHRENRLSLVVK